MECSKSVSAEIGKCKKNNVSFSWSNLNLGYYVTFFFLNKLLLIVDVLLRTCCEAWHGYVISSIWIFHTKNDVHTSNILHNTSKRRSHETELEYKSNLAISQVFSHGISPQLGQRYIVLVLSYMELTLGFRDTSAKCSILWCIHIYYLKNINAHASFEYEAIPFPTKQISHVDRNKLIPIKT